MVTERFIGRPGRIVDIASTLAGCRAILDGAGDDMAESAFYMVGDFEEAVEKERLERNAA